MDRGVSLMKKKIVLFVTFVVMFFGAMLCINYFIPPDRMMPPINGDASIQQIETAKGTYLGETLVLIFQGFGEFAFLSGEKYLGSWDNSFMDGDGRLVFPGAGIYDGAFDDGLRVGDGTFTWEDGDIYKGYWGADAMSGEGVYTFSNGCVVTGIFANNKITEGQISYEEAVEDSESATIVYWSSGIQAGKIANPVEFRTSAGLIYSGEFPESNKTVTVEITYPDGNKYIGELVNGIRSGSGKFEWYTDGTLQAIYDGEWADDMMEGDGIYQYTGSKFPYITGTFSSGVPIDSCIYQKDATYSYDTEWVDGRCVSVKEQ
jgi:hypothetical protein